MPPGLAGRAAGNADPHREMGLLPRWSQSRIEGGTDADRQEETAAEELPPRRPPRRPRGRREDADRRAWARGLHAPRGGTPGRRHARRDLPSLRRPPRLARGGGRARVPPAASASRRRIAAENG